MGCGDANVVMNAVEELRSDFNKKVLCTHNLDTTNTV